MIGIVVPTKTDAYARRLLRSLATCEPEFLTKEARVGEMDPRVVFIENGLTEAFVDEVVTKYHGVDVDENPGPFVFARAINLGVNLLDSRADILVMNDDAVFCSPQPIAALEALLADPIATQPFGVLGLRAEGGVGNQDQARPFGPRDVYETDQAVCFVAALIPRRVWGVVGPLDERYTGYGMDDVDYCRRIVAAGLRLGVTGAAVVRHGGVGVSGPGMHGTYARESAKVGPDEHTRLYQLNQRLYAEKWGESGRGMISARPNT